LLVFNNEHGLAPKTNVLENPGPPRLLSAFDQKILTFLSQPVLLNQQAAEAR
jgi:hypothetical protein